MILLDDVVGFLDQFFTIERFPDEPGRIYRSSQQPIRRIGLALEAWSGMAVWAEQQKLDAVFLHRLWKPEPTGLSDALGVISYHMPFDERIALGFNTRLADALGMTNIETLGKKDGRPIGMIGNVRVRHVAEYFRVVHSIFGGIEESRTSEHDSVRRVAVVSAMNKTLVHLAAARGADVYITGESRQQGRVGVLETGIGVVIVGHRRSEEWGLRALAGVLRDRWASLEVVTAPASAGTAKTA